MSKASRMDNWRHLLVSFSLASMFACSPEPSGNIWHEESIPQDQCSHGCDQDGDQVSDDQDNCPEHPNPNQDDQDNDGRGDLCDAQPSQPNYRMRDSKIERAPKMSDGTFVLRTQTKRTPHRSNDGVYRLTVEARP